MSNAANDITSPSTNVATAKTTPFDPRTASRCGTAASVARIMPVPYSELMTSTPSAPMATWAR